MTVTTRNRSRRSYNRKAAYLKKYGPKLGNWILKMLARNARSHRH
jgi:hypothetical protein